jgi:Tfp pilus assembly protein PilO
MTLSDRDRKIVLVLVPIVLVAALWFLVIGPKRSEAVAAGERLAKAEKKRDQAEQTVARLEQSKKTFGSDYVELVRIGKAIPTKLDTASLIVQLGAAAKSTNIKFTDISAAEGGVAASGPSSAAPPAAPGTGNGSQPAAAGGAPAQSTPGQQAEGAGNGVNAANDSTAANTPPANGAAPTTGAPAAAAPVAGGCAPGLECVPLELSFSGRFFDLADFFHELKRFVRVTNNRLEVRGRLLTVEKLKFSSDEFPTIKAEMTAVAYLSPQAEGATAGAAPQGPAQTTPAAGAQPAPAAPIPPTSTVTSP